MNVDIEKIIKYSRGSLKQEKVSGFDHAQRVEHWCRYIGEKLNADLSTLQIAALLHDIGLQKVGLDKHHIESAEMAKAFLREKQVPKEQVESIASIIEHHSMHAPEATSIEEKILNDADRIDHLGAIGIVREIARAILVRKDYSGDIADVPRLLRQGITKTKKRTYTDIAKKIVDERARFVEEFIERLEKELEQS